MKGSLLRSQRHEPQTSHCPLNRDHSRRGRRGRLWHATVQAMKQRTLPGAIVTVTVFGLLACENVAAQKPVPIPQVGIFEHLEGVEIGMTVSELRELRPGSSVARYEGLVETIDGVRIAYLVDRPATDTDPLPNYARLVGVEATYGLGRSPHSPGLNWEDAVREWRQGLGLTFTCFAADAGAFPGKDARAMAEEYSVRITRFEISEINGLREPELRIRVTAAGQPPPVPLGLPVACPE